MLSVGVGTRGRIARPLSAVALISGPWGRVLSLVVLVALWQIGAQFADPVVLPPPSRVAEAWWKLLLNGNIPEAVAVTLWRATKAFVIAMVLGSAIGIALGRNRNLNQFFDGWVMLGLNMPALVVGILCYIWFGLNEFALVLAVVINKVPLVAITVREGAAAIQPDLLHVAKAFRLSRVATFRKVLLPQLYPYLMAAARSGLALIWKIVLVFELLGQSSGIGYQLSANFSLFYVHRVLAYALSFIAVVMVIEAVIVRPLERRATKWRL